MKKRNTLALIARADPCGKILGYVVCASTGINMHISKIAVSPTARRLGIGRTLMREAMVKAAKERRAMSSSLNVAVDNEPALALYK